MFRRDLAGSGSGDTNKINTDDLRGRSPPPRRASRILFQTPHKFNLNLRVDALSRTATSAQPLRHEALEGY
jgi:hypothetical protein